MQRTCDLQAMTVGIHTMLLAILFEVLTTQDFTWTQAQTMRKKPLFFCILVLTGLQQIMVNNLEKVFVKYH